MGGQQNQPMQPVPAGGVRPQAPGGQAMPAGAGVGPGGRPQLTPQQLAQMMQLMGGRPGMTPGAQAGGQPTMGAVAQGGARGLPGGGGQVRVRPQGVGG